MEGRAIFFSVILAPDNSEVSAYPVPANFLCRNCFDAGLCLWTKLSDIKKKMLIKEKVTAKPAKKQTNKQSEIREKNEWFAGYLSEG